MQLGPDEFVFLALHRGDYRWFISPRDFWVLDQGAWARAFEEAGFGKDDDPASGRFGMLVVDAGNAEAFLRAMAPFAVDLETVRRARDLDDEPKGLALFVDFDRATIHVGEVESPDFAAYLPPGWTAEVGVDPAVLPEALRGVIM